MEGRLSAVRAQGPTPLPSSPKAGSEEQREVDRFQVPAATLVRTLQKSSQTRNGTCVPCSGSTESLSRDLQEIPGRFLKFTESLIGEVERLK